MRTTTATTARTSRGIALVDLLLVVAILGIVSAIAVRAPDDPGLHLDAAARELAADLSTAQALALSTRTALGVRFDTAAGTARFALGNGVRPVDAEATLRAGALTATEVERLLAARARGDRGWPRVRIASADFGGAAQATFEPDGSVRDGGMVELRAGGTWLRVRVQAGSGRIVVTAP